MFTQALFRRADFKMTIDLQIAREEKETMEVCSLTSTFTISSRSSAEAEEPEKMRGETMVFDHYFIAIFQQIGVLLKPFYNSYE